MYELFLRPKSYLLSFPRFWTLPNQWFWFLFWSILYGVALTASNSNKLNAHLNVEIYSTSLNHVHVRFAWCHCIEVNIPDNIKKKIDCACFGSNIRTNFGFFPLLYRIVCCPAQGSPEMIGLNLLGNNRSRRISKNNIYTLEGLRCVYGLYGEFIFWVLSSLAAVYKV